MTTTNRYSPHYDHDEQRVIMSIDPQGSWVHIHEVATLTADLNRYEAVVFSLNIQIENLKNGRAERDQARKETPQVMRAALERAQSKETGYEVAILNLKSMLARAEQQHEMLTAERDAARTLARQAVNGWACYATRKIEQDEITRLHAALDDDEAAS